MIFQAETPLIVPKIMVLAKKLENDPSVLEKELLESFQREDARIFVEQKDGNLRGFIFATIEVLEGAEAVFIQSCVVLPDVNEKSVCNELLARVRKWGAQLGMKDMYFMTRRSPDAFKRKYHFRYHSTLLKRRINDERTFQVKEG